MEEIKTNTLENLRAEIDCIDQQLFELLRCRNNISKQIGEYKKQNNLTILQTQRYSSMMKQRIALAKEMGIDPLFAEQLIELIHKESVSIQEASKTL